MKKFIFILIGTILLSACTGGKEKGCAYSDIDIKIVRYDKLIYEATAMNSFLALQKMNTKHPQATKILIEEVLDLGEVNSSRVNEQLCDFYSDSLLVKLMEDALEKFKDMSGIEKQLTHGFRALKKELPSITIPKVYAQISALNQSVVVGNNLLGFSIDKYMGEDYPLYKKFYYSHQRKSMAPENIVPDCFMYYLVGQYPFMWKKEHRTLFDLIIYRGKLAWIIEKIFDKDMSGKFSLGYCEEDIEWCNKNKEKIWGWMLDSQYLHSNNPMIIRSYIHNSQPIMFRGKQLPPSFGIWLGIQIVDKYMKKHKEFTIQQLLECSDFASLIDVKDLN